MGIIIDPRVILREHFAAHAKPSMSEVSKTAGMNHAYLQQFIKRGKPARLPEDVRAIVSRETGISEALLGASRRPALISSYDPDAPEPVASDDLLDNEQIRAARRAAARELRPGEIIERDARGGLGSGSYAAPLMVDGRVVDNVRATWTFPTDFLHTELRAREPDVDILPVDGDSMIPTLLPGDRVMIHRGSSAPSPDGLFAIDDGIGTSIKRLEIVRGSDPLQVNIISDNAVHRPQTLLASDLKVIGRVICKVTRL